MVNGSIEEEAAVKHQQHGTKAGFTLIELLVVIAILGTLAALVSPMLGLASRKALLSTTKQEIQRLTLAIEGYQGDRGDFPPTSLADEYGISSNDIDSGSESLVAHLASLATGTVYFEFKEEYLENLDADRIADIEIEERLSWVFGDDQLREYVDPWGHPYIYFHNRDYRIVFTVTSGAGNSTQAKASMSEKTATYHSPTSFQIWSCGPDGINQNGSGDDIVSW